MPTTCCECSRVGWRCGCRTGPRRPMSRLWCNSGCTHYWERCLPSPSSSRRSSSIMVSRWGTFPPAWFATSPSSLTSARCSWGCTHRWRSSATILTCGPTPVGRCEAHVTSTCTRRGTSGTPPGQNGSRGGPNGSM